MQITEIKPPREFEVGWTDQKIRIKDCAHVALQPDEQVTFFTESAGEYDVARKNWGFYATPSTNSRLPRFRLHAALVRNRIGQAFVLLVEEGHEAEFEAYVRSEQLRVIARLDREDELDRLERAMKEA
jgi:hypothetical protein